MGKCWEPLVRENEPRDGNCRRMVLEFPAPLDAEPGQFFQFDVRRGGTDPLLRRPLSIAGAEGRSFTFFYQVKGRGTLALGRCRPGERLPVIGPLGKGYPRPPGRKIIVGGGLGAAGLLFLAAVLRADPEERDVSILLGARSRQHLALETEFRQFPFQTGCTTDDGSCGRCGTVCDLLGETIADASGPGTIYACGPTPMLREVSRVAAARPGLKVFVSLEMMMACGFGVCRGCVVPTASGYRAACTEGPVFDASEILWDEYA